jgi:O-antigen ligase
VLPKSPISKLLIVLIVFYYLSLWQGALFVHTTLPFFIDDPRFSDWKNYVEMFLIAFVVAKTVRKKWEVGLVIVIMCFTVLLVNRSYASILSGRDVSHFSYDVRDSGALGYAGVNGFAAFEGMFASFLLGLYACQKRILVKVGILGLLATCAYCLLYSFSRGGYLGLLVGLLTVGVLKARHFLVMVFVVLIGWQVLMPASVQERILMTTEGDVSGQTLDSSSLERLELWEDAISMFKKNPITGTGFDTYQLMGRVVWYKDTHNYYVKVLAETGIVGFALYLFLLAKLLSVANNLFRNSTDHFWTSLGLGFLALLMSAVVLNFFGDRWTYQQVDGYLWVLLGCAIRGLMTMQEERVEARSIPEAGLREAEPVAV